MNTSSADVDTNWRARAEMNGIKVENGDTDTRKGAYMRLTFRLVR
jgi:hypothetical protein